MFCNKCGAKLLEGSVFCSGCGNQISSVEQPLHTINPEVSSENMQCPKCESHNLQATVEATTTGSSGGYSGAKGCLGFLLLGPLGLLCGSGGRKANSSTQHKTFWICLKCGHKFRKREEAIEESLMNLLSFVGLFIVSIIGLSFLPSLRLPSSLETSMMLGLAIMLIASIIMAVVHGFDYNKLSEEQKAFLKKSKKDETK